MFAVVIKKTSRNMLSEQDTNTRLLKKLPTFTNSLQTLQYAYLFTLAFNIQKYLFGSFISASCDQVLY